MPYTRMTFSNPNGEPPELSEVERSNIAQANQMRDYQIKQALLGQNANALKMQLADNAEHRRFLAGEGAAGRAAQLEQHGRFSDKSAHEVNLLNQEFAGKRGLAEVEGGFHVKGIETATAPAMLRAQLDDRKYTNEWEAGAPERAALAEKYGFQGDILRGMRGGANGGGPTFTPQQQAQLGFGAMGMDPTLAIDPDEVARRKVRETMMTKAVDALSNPDPQVRAWGQRFLSQNGVDGLDADSLGAMGGPGGEDNFPGPSGMPNLGASPVKPEDIERLVAQQLPDFINRDTELGIGTAFKAGTAAAAGAAGAGAIGGSFAPGIGTAMGALGAGIGGFGVGFAGGLIKGSKSDPGAAEMGNLEGLFQQLVQAYTRANGGNTALAKQQALAKFKEIALTSDQGDDYLDDWASNQTNDLFRRIGR